MIAQNLLDAVVIEPKSTAKASILWLHGLGANGHDFEDVVPMLGLADELGVRFIFPHAPQIPVTLNQGMVMPAWFDILGLHSETREDVAGLDRARGMVEQWIQHELDLGIMPSQIILAGFSQGGALALHTALQSKHDLGGCFVLSGYLAARNKFQASDIQANKSLPIFWGHGSWDAVVPQDWASKSITLLENSGWTVEFHSYPMEHQICQQEMMDLRTWLLARLKSNQ